MAEPINAPRELVAVFEDEATARSAVRHLTEVGVASNDIRIGNSLDALASVAGEMREELGYVGAMPAPVTRGSTRGVILGVILGTIVGLVIALPFAAIRFGGFQLPGRLLLLGVLGVVFGSFLGGFLGGAFGIERSDVPVAASVGTTVAVLDSEPNRDALCESGAIRIDLVGIDGPVETLVTNAPGPTAIAGQIVENVATEEKRG